MSDHAQEIGRLQESTEAQSKSIVRLFKSNEKRKEDFHELELKFQSIQHTVEETNVTTNKAVGLMEELVKDVKDVKEHVTHIDNRVTALESDKFDIIKILRWLGTWRGTFFMISVSAMLIGAIFPDAREWISSLFGMAAKAAY